MTMDPITLVTHVEPDAEELAAEQQGTLTVVSGQQVGAVFLLRADTSIGRAHDTHVSIDDESLSRRHARIVRVGKQYEVEDLGSTNGTFLGGERVLARTQLVDGMRVQFANVVMRFSLQEPLEAVATRRIYEMSVRDGLTGLHNRRHFDERIAAELAYALRHKTPLCVILLDLDHFKDINDRLGHQAGDLVLRRVADTLQATVRAEDVLSRFGGEEFALIARGIDEIGSQLFAERLRMLVEKLDVRFGEEYVRVTVSLGVAHTHALPNVRDEEAFIAAADRALYAAKHAGKNRVVCASGQSDRPDAVHDESRSVVRKRRGSNATMDLSKSELFRNRR
jgi:two-component system cell cycle response regulator